MNTLDHEQFLESVARLTEKRNRESLETCLIQTMLELLSVEKIALYRIESDEVHLLTRTNREGFWSVDDTTDNFDTPIPIASDAGFVACSHRRETVLESAAPQNNRYTFPIVHQDRLVGFLRLASTRNLGADCRLIGGFLRIYQNYLALIDENEHDTLTGLLNRKTFDDKLIGILQASRRTILTGIQWEQGERRQANSGRCYWLAVLDIDHFKCINDTFGHLYGDEVLLLMANLMRRSFRRADMLFRYGGEEFVVVLLTNTVEEAWIGLERFRQAVEHHNFPQVGRITVSIGFTQMRDSEIPTAIIERADQALYYAKGHGRNQIQCYETLVTTGKLINPQSQFGDAELF
ncbi:MAG: GGDEF domain-containing protein [Candidatus Competibacteraceae bacterium]